MSGAWDVTITKLRPGRYLVHAQRSMGDGWREQRTLTAPSLKAAKAHVAKLLGGPGVCRSVVRGQWWIAA